MPTRSFSFLVALALVVAACGSSDTTVEETQATSTSTAAQEPTDSTAANSTDDIVMLFDDGALTAETVIVPCTLDNGSETTCYQLEANSLPDTVQTDGPYCPSTVGDAGGIWVWDGDDPGLYALDADFWAMMDAQGYEFADADGAITITDPGAGSASGGATANSCLEATADGSYHLQILLPTAPELLDEPVELSTISQVGFALDGVTIFGDAPSVADRGGLPALDPCGGHIDPSGYYHWHFGAASIQTNLDEAGADVECWIDQDVEALIGFSFDGFPIYGPEEDGSVPTDLDECNGHVSDTEEFGEIYHYHMSYASPNLPPCRVGAAAAGALSSPDSDAVSLPGGAGGGSGGGPPPGQDGEG